MVLIESGVMVQTRVSLVDNVEFVWVNTGLNRLLSAWVVGKEPFSKFAQ